MRSRSPEAATEVIEVGALRVDVRAHTVAIDGAPIHLSPKEFDLLAMLAAAAGRVCTHRQLLEKIWGPSHRHDVQYLRVYVGQLREKLGKAGASYITNEPGIGYRLVAPAAT